MSQTPPSRLLIDESNKHRSARWLSPAKVNIFLNILGKRANRYHDLQSLMVPLSFGDEIVFEFSSGSSPFSVTLDIPGSDLTVGADNLISRAAMAFAREARIERGNLKVSLQKRIPVAAGLGGGSSNAAVTLLAMNRFFDSPLPLKSLQEIGVSLGADVPFFLLESASYAEGIGEVLTPVKSPAKVHFLLVNPGFHVSTRWVYENLDLSATMFSRGLGARFALSQILGKPWEELLNNDLEAVTLREFPVLGEIKTELLRSGAVGSLMSGSGPTVFGIFRTTEEALDALGKLEGKNKHWKVFLAHNNL